MGRIYLIEIGPQTPPTITISVTGATPDGTEGIAYSTTFSATGGVSPYTFAVTSGALPDGLSLSSGGAVTGTPTTVETAAFTITATDADGNTGSESFAIEIAAFSGNTDALEIYNSCIAWYAFEETTGGKGGVIDSHIYSYHLTREDAFIADTGVIGNCSAAASGNGWIFSASPPPTALRLESGSYTIAGNVNSVFNGANSNNGLVCRWGIADSTRSYVLLFEAGKVVHAVSTDGVNNAARVETAATYNDASWHSFFAHRDTDNDLISVQADGATPVTASFSGASTLHANSCRLVFHRLQDNVGTYAGTSKLDEVAIFQPMLSPSAQAYLYNGGAWRSYQDIKDAAGIP